MGGSYSRIAAEKRAKEAALLAAPVPLHRHSVTCIKFCNGGDLVLTASEDRTLALWDFSQGQKFGKLWRLNKLTDPCSKPAEDAAAANGHPASVGVLPPPSVLKCPLGPCDGIQQVRAGGSQSRSEEEVLALPRSGWPTFFDLTCWACGTIPSTLKRKSARAHEIGETKSTEIELEGRQQRRSEPSLGVQVLRCPLPGQTHEGILPRPTREC